MVDKGLISQLQSLNAAQRKDAIMALGRTKDRDAIPHLNTIVENDPESDLRELARKAAIYIDMNSPAANVKPFTMPWDDEEPEEEDAAQPVSRAAELIPDYEVTTEADIAAKQDREWAERYIELAYQSYFTSDREAAEIYMRKALERYPVIAEENLAREAASKIMNMTPEKAIAALTKPVTTSRNSATNAIRKTTGAVRLPSRAITAARAITGATAILGENPDQTADEVEDGSFLTLIFDLVMFFVIVSALELLAFIAVDGILVEALTSSRAPVDMFTGAMRDLVVGLDGAPVGDLLSYALIAGVQWLIIYLIISFLTHIVAFSLFDGNSTFPRLIRKTYLAYAAVFSLVSTALAVTIYIAYTPQNPTPWQTGFAISALLGSFLIAWRIGSAYRFDFARGCFTIILTSVAALCCTLSISLALIVANVGPFAGLADRILPR
jgi:hypothetical protein